MVDLTNVTDLNYLHNDDRERSTAVCVSKCILTPTRVTMTLPNVPNIVYFAYWLYSSAINNTKIGVTEIVAKCLTYADKTTKWIEL